VAFERRRILQSDTFVGFRSGNHRLDGFLKRHAGLDDLGGQSATHLVLDGERVVAFVTVVGRSVESSLLKQHVEGLSDYPAPVLLLARMATDRRYQRRGIGRTLLTTVYETARTLRLLSGCVGVIVDAKPSAVSFYEHTGFVALGVPASADASTLMFLPFEKIASQGHGDG
jgi:GNAT superfamily N-acetyltransferase